MDWELMLYLNAHSRFFLSLEMVTQLANGFGYVFRGAVGQCVRDLGKNLQRFIAVFRRFQQIGKYLYRWASIAE